jgi:hypothetical protein
MHFVDVFDTGRNGVITREEYLNFARFMMIMSFMDTEEGAKVQQNMEEAAQGYYNMGESPDAPEARSRDLDVGAKQMIEELPPATDPSPNDILADLMKASGAGLQSRELSVPEATTTEAPVATTTTVSRELAFEPPPPQQGDDISNLSANLAALGIDVNVGDAGGDDNFYHEKSAKLSAENDHLRDQLSSLEDLIKTLESH